MKSIVQLEFTNQCNRRCSYCGHVNMQREKGFMDLTTLKRSIWVLQQLKQTTVGIQHYGESLMHPEVIPFIQLMNDNGIKPWLYTNGDFLSDKLIDSLSQLQLETLTISGHAKVERRIELFQKCSSKGIKAYWQRDVKEEASNLAGQVPFEAAIDKSYPVLQDPANHCKFLVQEYAIVLFNGDLVPCCFDYEGVGVFGNIFDENVLNLSPKVNPLCATCPGHPGNVV